MSSGRVGGEGQQVLEVIDHEIRPGVEQLLRASTAVDSEHQAEVARPSGLDAGMGILDDNAVGGSETQQLRRVQLGVWRRLAGKSLGRSNHPVDDNREAIGNSGGFEYCGRIA